MIEHRRLRRIVVAVSLGVVSVGVGSLAFSVPGLSWASAARTSAASTSTTSKATTTTTTIKKSTTVTKTTGHYEVVDGIFSTKAAAQKRIDALTKAKFKHFTIKVIAPKFAVVHAGLTKTQATALVKAIKVTKIGSPRIKKLA